MAYDAENGKETWRFWTVPGDPAKGFETKALEMAAKTWSGKDSWKIGGGDVWTAITYDPATGLVIFGTAGAGVDYGELSSIKVAGDKLFAGCIIAVNAETGEYAWHFQTSAPGLQTENNHILLADLVIDGEKRHDAMTAPKNGFFTYWMPGPEGLSRRSPWCNWPGPTRLISRPGAPTRCLPPRVAGNNGPSTTGGP